MKARIENGIITIYEVLPSIFESTTGLVLAGYETLSEDVHQADGFYDLITPKFDEFIEYLSPVYFDEVNKIFTYNVIQREVPIPRPVKSVLTPLEFLNRFTNDEIKTVLTLSKTDPDVEVWWLKYNKAQDIDLNDPQTIGGVQALEDNQIIAPGRAAEILTKQPI